MIRKLAIMKRIYQNAVLLTSNSYSIMNRILSVIHFDMATEILLRSIINSIDPKVRTDTETTFPKLIQQVNDLLIKSGFSESSILVMRVRTATLSRKRR